MRGILKRNPALVAAGLCALALPSCTLSSKTVSFTRSLSNSTGGETPIGEVTPLPTFTSAPTPTPSSTPPPVAAKAMAYNSLNTVDPNIVIPSASALIPDGVTANDEIPNTLDLAEVAQKYLDGITNTLLPEYPYFHLPPGQVDMHGTPTSIFEGGAPNWGKTIQAMIMARRMSGYDLNDTNGTLTAQLMSTRNMIDPNVGRNLISRGEGAWIVITGALPENQITTAVEGMMELFKQFPSPDLQQLIQQMITYHTTTVTSDHNDDGEPSMHYELPTPGVSVFTPKSTGTTGYGDLPFTAGKAMRALATWYMLVGDTQALNTAELLSNYIRNFSGQLYWRVPPGFPEGSGNGHFAGHMHEYANALMGILWEAQARLKANPNDAKAQTLIGFVKDSYFFIRNMHSSASMALGNFGEICTTADMLRLAVKLTELGAGDFNEDIERWIRNQIAESQIKGAITIVANPSNPLKDNIGKKVIGLFFEDATHALKVPDTQNTDLNLQLVACGLGNVIHGIYDVWEHIVQFKNNIAQVNLLLNKATWYLDVKSEIPYRGAVNVITRANIGPIDTIELRVPDGINPSQVQVTANGSPVSVSWARTNFVHISGVKPNTKYTVNFPLIYKQIAFRQVRNQNQGWAESDYSPDPGNGHDYSFHENSPENMYTGTFRGNTLVSVDHLPSGSGISLYQGSDRAYWATLGANNAPSTPTHTVARFRVRPK